MTHIDDEDFFFYQKLLLERSGLSLTPEKKYLLHTRLTPVAQSLGYQALGSMTLALRMKLDPVIVRTVVEAMTTNETSFFRDTKPFQYLVSEILPEFVKSHDKTKTLRIWCAACSSGQEPYSIAMALQDFFKDKPGWRYSILGTDISDEMLDQARKGQYSQFEIQRGLSIQMMVKHFKQEGTRWHISPEIKECVQFRNFNLMDDMALLGSFDIVFCRNVLIYFNAQDKEKVLNRIHGRLASDGKLLLGACETVMGLSTPFTSVQGMNGVYTPAMKNQAKIISSSSVTAGVRV